MDRQMFGSRARQAASCLAQPGAGTASIATVCEVGFALVQIWPGATRGYAVGLGWLRWLMAGARGSPPTVAATADATDLWAVPVTVLPIVPGDDGGCPGAPSGRSDG